MPEANATGPLASAATTSDPAHPYDKDRVGEELADDARIWRVYDRIARADDKERIDSWNSGLDNLALFAGLFSAVTTAFIIEAQKDMKVDYTQLAFQALNASLAGDPFTPAPFVVSASSRTVTCLWVTSLLLSLSAALIAIMGKDWIGMYSARPVCNARQWAEIRTYRLHCVERSYMSQVIATAPVLLHLSLLLFGAGLVVFMPQDPITRHLTLAFVIAGGVLYLVTALSAVVFPGSPFKSPATEMIRGAIASLVRLDLWTLRLARSPELAHTSRSRAKVVDRARNFFHSIPSRLCSIVNDAPNLFRSIPAQLRSIMNGASDLFYSIPAMLLSASETCRSLSRTAYDKIRSATIWSSLRNFHIGDLLHGSPWTDVRSQRSEDSMAKALSWLSSTSQAPEVLRAIMFALGDLDFGGEVAHLVHSDLRDRIREVIQTSWRQTDFLTLSRYVLADQNLSKGEGAILNGEQFQRRIALMKKGHLRCEDGLVAAAKLGTTSIDNLQSCFPDEVAQTRIAFLLIEGMTTPHIIFVLGRYADLLDESHFDDLERALSRILDTQRRAKQYQYAVKHEYDKKSGLVELLVFLVLDGVLKDYGTEAIDILLRVTQIRDAEYHPCMVYLLGGTLLWTSEMGWTTGRLASIIARSIDVSTASRLWGPLHSIYSEALTPFDLALVRTTVPVLAPRWETSGRDMNTTLSMVRYNAVRQLCRHLCQEETRNELKSADYLNIIDLVLRETTLPRIMGLSWKYNKFLILYFIARFLDRMLPLGMGGADEAGSRDRGRRAETDGIRLFSLFVFSQAKTRDGATVTWDLGDYLRAQWVHLRKNRVDPSMEQNMRGVLDHLKEIYSRFDTYPELRAHWDRMKFPEDFEQRYGGKLADFFAEIQGGVAAEAHAVEVPAAAPAVKVPPAAEHAVEFPPVAPAVEDPAAGPPPVEDPAAAPRVEVPAEHAVEVPAAEAPVEVPAAAPAVEVPAAAEHAVEVPAAAEHAVEVPAAAPAVEVPAAEPPVEVPPAAPAVVERDANV